MTQLQKMRNCHLDQSGSVCGHEVGMGALVRAYHEGVGSFGRGSILVPALVLPPTTHLLERPLLEILARHSEHGVPSSVALGCLHMQQVASWVPWGQLRGTCPGWLADRVDG